ncbi:MAG: YdcF family protein [Ignavibacteriales bacterium]|nr:YdcF family protein [Ignavibacteriales bacterium]
MKLNLFNIFKKLLFAKIILISALIFDLYLLLRLKYKINNLSFDEFHLTNIGNLLNLILTFLLLIGLIIVFFNRNLIWKKLKALIYFTVGVTLPLMVLLVIILFDINFVESYFLQYPIRKVIIALIFGISEFFKLFLLVYVWSLIISKREYIILRSFFVSLMIIGGLIFFSFSYYLFHDTDKYKVSLNTRQDIAVVLGAAVWSNNKPSPIFEGRLKKAYELYKNGIIKKIQLTGGNAPGEVSEAEAGYEYLINLGIDKNDMFVEEKTSTTSEQIFFIKKRIIEKMNFDEVVIISDGYHLIRVNEICNFYNVNAVLCNSNNNITWNELLLYKAKDSIGLLLFWLFAVQ